MEWTREHDAVIARELGWILPPYSSIVGQMWVKAPEGYVHPEGPPTFLSAPTPESDYEVLRWVREHPEAHPTAQGWAGAVASQLWSMWSLRAIDAGASVEPYADVPMHYQAGDYAVALYAVLQEEAK